MKTSSAKAKGRSLQKWACQKVSDLLGLPWGYEDDKLIQPRLMGQSGTDVVLRGEARDFEFDIECKNTESLSLYKDIEQAKANTAKDRNWLLIHKKNKSKPIAVIDADLLFKLLKQISDDAKLFIELSADLKNLGKSLK